MEIQDRLAEIIQSEKTRIGSFEQLAHEIAFANCTDKTSSAERKLLRVDRRKLSDMARREKVTLTVYELQALNTYLARNGKQGLKAVFEKPTVIRALTDTKQVHFLIGAKPQPDDTFALSRWDVRSMITMIHDIHSISTAVLIDIHDVLLKPSVRRPKSQIKGQEVHELLDDNNGPSIVCIGSPRACHASEFMLAKMFGVEPFQRVRNLLALDLPAYFVWSDDQFDALPSSFALRMRDVLSPTQAMKGWRSVALKTTQPEAVHPVDRSRKTWRNYGALFMQRRQSGKLWIVAGGLSGPATLAVAKSLASVSDELLLENCGQHSPVVWAVVEAHVERESSRKDEGENRILAGERIVLPPKRWPPV